MTPNLPCNWRRRWPTRVSGYVAALAANVAMNWDRPVVANHCGECDGWHLYRARPEEADRVAAMRAQADREAVVLDEWTCQDDYGWEVVVTRYETICLHCRKPFHGQVSARGRRASIPRYCSRTHSSKAQATRKAARERKGARRLAR